MNFALVSTCSCVDTQLIFDHLFDTYREVLSTRTTQPVVGYVDPITFETQREIAFCGTSTLRAVSVPIFDAHLEIAWRVIRFPIMMWSVGHDFLAENIANEASSLAKT